MSWGIEGRASGVDSSKLGKDDVYRMKNSVKEKPPRRPATSAKEKVPIKGEYPDRENKIGRIKNVQYVSIFNLKKHGPSPNPPGVHTVIQTDDKREWLVEGEYKLVGSASNATFRPGQVVNVVGINGGTATPLFGNSSIHANMWDIVSHQVIKVWHVDRYHAHPHPHRDGDGDDPPSTKQSQQGGDGDEPARGGNGDENDPSCWVVVEGVSTYVCGCG